MTRGNVSRFQVIDHGEDGSQYFPGCGVALTSFDYVSTGVGDTAEEALSDALEQMAMGEPEARPSEAQEAEMRSDWLNKPSDKSAHDSLDAHDCEDGCDWHHYVSIRYCVLGRLGED